MYWLYLIKWSLFCKTEIYPAVLFCIITCHNKENILRWKTEIDVKFCLIWSVRFINSVFHGTWLYPTVFRRLQVSCENTSLKNEYLIFSYLYRSNKNSTVDSSYSKQTVKCACNYCLSLSGSFIQESPFNTVWYDYSILLASCQVSMYDMLFWSLWVCLDLAYFFLLNMDICYYKRYKNCIQGMMTSGKLYPASGEKCQPSYSTFILHSSKIQNGLNIIWPC